ncbi:MAG: ABC transporter substrate-binding protein [Oscillospiraceae bacterium]|nr:ABC transporter substrate-binding protein [Oscillospiraceae bacterium]MDD7277941.1 ABC transporter substrate-binding protein [Oscillospiraceae bacterium]
MRKAYIFLPLILCLAVLTACGKTSDSGAFDLENTPSEHMELLYADQFSVDRYENGISLVTVGDGEKYLLVPENETVETSGDITVINTPVDNIYLAASSAMDLFFGIGADDRIFAASTLERDWSLPYVKQAMSDEDILYAGKYSAPDYELILSEGCGIAIESTMIYHKPEVKEQLERFGIPVFVERSSYESHPLGRLEWVKLYGLMTGNEEEAEKLFSEQSELLQSVSQNGSAGKTAAFFYISQNGSAVVRKPDDYVSKMIQLAGGEYIFTSDDLNTEENAQSTTDMQFEAFYAAAKDADVLIYSSTIDGGIDDISALFEKNSLFADFKAVKTGNVWCTDKNMFQQTTAAAEIISDLNLIFTDNAGDETEFFYKLK